MSNKKGRKVEETFRPTHTHERVTLFTVLTLIPNKQVSLFFG